MKSARSAGRMSSVYWTSAVAAWFESVLSRPDTSETSTVRVSPRREKPRAEVRTLWTCRVEITQSFGRRWRIATSRICTCPDPSFMVTTRSKSSETTRVSMGRWLKERILSSPVVMTDPDSMEVMRVSGRNTRLRGPTSTTTPMTLASDLRRNTTTTSWTLPTWSPRGSNTEVPASLPM